MTFEEINKQALELLEKLSKEKKISKDDNLCVICSRSGKLYHGVSQKGSDPSEVIPAERAALGSMVMSGETAIDALMIINAGSKKTLLPEKDSVNYFITVNPDNINGVAMTEDDDVSFIEIGDSVLLNAPPKAKPAEEPVKKRESLLDKVNSLMEGVDDDDDDDEEFLEQLDKSKKKKKRFGFFG